MGYRKILVTLDGSKLAERALEHVLQIAEPNASIHLLSVMAADRPSEIHSLAKAVGEGATADDQWPFIQSPNDPREEEARVKYLLQVEGWLEQMDRHVTSEVRRGSVIDTIIEVLNRGFDILVIATHRRTGAAKLVVGSVTEAVLSKSPCPVLIVAPSQGGE
jgi:nucleotide-binding universal stress UspA family protein